jgi:hypothetical protein
MANGRLNLAQLVRFLVVKLTHLGSNFIFGMSIVFTPNYSLDGRRHYCRQRDALGDRFCESKDQVEPVFQIYSQV